MDVLKRAQEIFGNDHYATDACGIVIEEASDGHAVVSIELEGKHKKKDRKAAYAPQSLAIIREMIQDGRL